MRAAKAAGLMLVACALTFFAVVGRADAGATTGGWDAGAETGQGTTVIQRSAPSDDAAAGQPEIRLVALLTADGQQIDNGIVWHVFQSKAGTDGKSKLVTTLREASPTLKLEPGDYVVNAAFGRAHLTRKISVKPSPEPKIEQFVMNAGGLRLTALVGGAPAPAAAITYEIQSDRDQSDTRKVIMSGVKPGLIIRLNAGIYHIVSTYGDANAVVESDITVEAGKLTEAQVTHTAARTSFKLVARAGGEALPDTQWTILTKEGRIVKESVGALPMHLLAPGTYSAVARNQGRTFASEFTVADAQSATVEIVMAAGAQAQGPQKR